MPRNVDNSNRAEPLPGEQPALYRHQVQREIDRLNRLYATLTQITQLLVRTASREELLPAICRVVVEQGALDQASIAWLDPHTGCLVSVAGFGRKAHLPEPLGVGANLGSERLASWAKVLREGRPFVCNAPASSPAVASPEPAPSPSPLESSAWFPLRFQGQVCGVLSLQAATAGFFGSRELEFFTELAANLSHALDRCEDNRQRATAEAALRESESRFRHLLQNVPSVAVQGYRADGTVQYWNHASEVLYGYSAQEAIGRNLLDLIIPPEMRSGVAQALAHMAQTGQPIPASELSLVRKDGSRVAVFSSHATIQKPGQPPELFCIDIDISERKRMQEAIEQRIVALTRPLAQDTAIRFDQLFDVADIQRIQDEFAAATGVASIITQPDGTPITKPSHFTRLCSQIVRQTPKGCANCYKSDAILGAPHPAGPKIQLCLSGGLWDAGTSITVGGHHIANWLIGQVRDNTQTEAAMRAYAREIGVDETLFLEAFHEVPSMSRERFGQVAQALFTLAKQLSTSAYQNVQQARFITERQLAEAALERSERNYREIFNSTNEAIFFNDAATGRMLDVNDAMLRLYHCDSKAEVLAGNIGDLSANEPPYTEEEAQRRLHLAITQGPQTFEWLARKKTGERFWVEVSLRSSQIGGQGRVLAVVRDITERKRALDGLREERMFTETLLRSLPGIFYLYSYPELRLVRWNKNHETALGYGPEEIQLHSLFEWHPVETRKLVRQAVDAVMTKGDGMLESALLTKEGRLVPFLMTGTKLEIHGVSYLMGVGIDLSEHKRAEAALRENEARQRAMIANIADVIGIVDQEGVNRYKSPNLERWFGWKPEEVVGTLAWDNVHPEDLAATQGMFNRLLEHPTATATGQCRYRCKNGAYKWIEFTAVNLLPDPAIRGVLLNYHDITERQRAAEDRQRLQAQLAQAQKMESVGRLAGGVAHDFNNMLTAIQGNVALALLELPSGSPARDNLEEIQHCAQRSADLTRQLLAFARKQTVVPKVLNLNDTVLGMLKMLRRLIGEDIELIWRPAADVCPVKMDPSQVDQVLANLCVNARDAIAGVGKITLETARVTFQTTELVPLPSLVPGDYVLLSVSDTGCGMDKEVLEHLFEPFFTTKGLGLGTGLGLATVYGVVQQNHGFITVESQPGHGTTFKIYLPRHLDKAAPLPKDTPQPPPAGRGRETVLLVEDEPAILRIVRRTLESLGYTVLAASTPGEALRLAAEHAGTIDLLMTDVIMPEMNGRDLAKRLLSLYPNLKRLFMSGYTADVIAHRGVLDEGVHFIQKPFNIPTLADKVREALEA